MPYINRKQCNVKPVPYASGEPDGAKYYNSKYWKTLRNQFIREHPICHDCMLEGKSTPAEECHHIIPFFTGKDDEERWRLLLDPNNLVSLCIMHHHRRHKMMNSSRK